MRKLRYRAFCLLLVLTPVIYLISACSCNCGKNTDGTGTVKGYITVIGNEPFTHLAIRTKEGKNLALQCSKELKNDLLKKQGRLYLIQFGDALQEDGMTILVVEKAIPIERGDN